MAPSQILDAAALLRKHGVRPRHSLGQNFLEDTKALQRIVQVAAIGPQDSVLEIGCGLGSLTGFLAEAAGRVIAVELDARMGAIAEENLRAYNNIRIIHGDFLELNLKSLDLAPGFVVAANIPYYVTSPILRRLLEAEVRPRTIVLTVQKEVAARICASPPRMSLLAVSVQVYGWPKLEFDIPASAFYPRPKVDSAVVRVDPSAEGTLVGRQRDAFFRLARAGFGQPRKMLRNTLASGLGMHPREAEALLGRAGIDPRRRAETLSVAEWLELTKAAGIPGDHN